MHLKLKVSLQGELPLPTQHTIKNGETPYGSTGLPTCRIRGIIDAKCCLKQAHDLRVKNYIDVKTPGAPCKYKIKTKKGGFVLFGFFLSCSPTNIQ